MSTISFYVFLGRPVSLSGSRNLQSNKVVAVVVVDLYSTLRIASNALRVPLRREQVSL